MFKQFTSYLSTYFNYLFFFKNYLKQKLLAVLIISVCVSFMDALSLSVFIPLFDVANANATAHGSKLSRVFSQLLDFLQLPATINSVLLIMVIFFSIKALFRFGDVYYRNIVNSYFISKIRTSLIDALAAVNYQKFTNTDGGTIQNTLTAEVNNVNSAYVHYISVIQHTVFILVYVGMSFWVNAKFTLIIVAGGFLSKWLLQRLYSHSKLLSFSVVQKNNRLASLVIQSVTNFKYLKSTASMPGFVAKIKDTIHNIEEDQLKIGLISSRVLALREPIVIVFLATAIYVQLHFFGGSLLAVLPSILFFYRAFNSLMNAQLSWTAFLKYVGSVQHMQEFQADLSAHAEPLVGTEFKGVESNITFSAVSFQYQPHQLILDQITLVIPKNKTIAVVGKSGSGKTTLLNILTGLLSPTAGQITVDGLPLSSFNRDSYRSKIGLITQEVVVFSDSLYNNVTLWAPKNPVNLTKFRNVLAQVDLLSFFTSHPLQEDVLLGDNGVIMSGGQRQRLAIARELYKDTSILLLDEATSALDTKTERFVQDRIDQIKGAMTLVIIAHRLSTIKSADLIVVLDEGKVLAQGNFKELMQTSSVFSSMVALQEM